MKPVRQTPSTRRRPLLSLQDVTKVFGKTTALEKVNVSVSQGEVVGFLGPNGAGKTTTIRVIMGLIRANAGQVKYAGRVITQNSTSMRAEIGYLGSDMVYEEGLTVLQYLHLVSSLRGSKGKERITTLADQLELDLGRKISQLSRGNRQKVGLIAAVMHHPKLLILDEPTSGFDPLMQQVFADIISEHTQRGGGAIISSHVLSEVQHLCDRAVFIHKGKVLGQQDIQSVMHTSPQLLHLHFSSQRKCNEASRSVERLTGISQLTTQGTQLSASYLGAAEPLLKMLTQIRPVRCTLRDAELEDIFLRYYGSPELADTEHESEVVI